MPVGRLTQQEGGAALREVQRGGSTQQVVHLGTDPRGDRIELAEIEAVDVCRVQAEHRTDLELGKAPEGVAQTHCGVGPGALRVRVVRSEHDLVDADARDEFKFQVIRDSDNG